MVQVEQLALNCMAIFQVVPIPFWQYTFSVGHFFLKAWFT